MPTLRLRIIGHHLPGRQFACYDNVHVAVQGMRREDVPNAVPGDAAEAVFTFDVDVVTRETGEIDFRGPYIHGKRGERFVYLAWAAVSAAGSFEMFRRAKLHLSSLDAQDIEHALTTSSPIEGSLDLTNAQGGPLCASVRPPLIQWRVLDGVTA
jgi:hypothetical protein